MTVTVYTRTDCHLCADAIETIRDVSEAVSVDVTLDLIDVDDHPELQAEYGDRVPYVLLDGRPAFKYRVDEAELRERLTG
jgi:glutaredoxin